MKFLIAIILFSSANAFAKLSVVTTTADLAYIAGAVAGDKASVQSIAKGTQDPHFIEAKPSFMVTLNRADLVVAIGLGFENAWLDGIVKGSRNPKIGKGSDGYLEVGTSVDPIEVPAAGFTRADGDVHPEGNPHITLDPIRDGKIAILIGDRMAKLDSGNGKYFQDNAKKFQKDLEDKTKLWEARMKKTGITKAITYHKTLNYFLTRFNVENSGTLEPKPGVPPTANHIIEVINKVKSENIKLILIENFFDPKVGERIKEEVKTVLLKSVPVSVGGDDKIKSLDDLFENLVKTFEEAK